MSHPITERLERLAPPLGPTDEVSAYIAVTAQNRKSHAFIILLQSPTRKEIRPILNRSTTSETTQPRALLGALLSTYEWVAQNAAMAKSCRIYSTAEYLYKEVQNIIERDTDSKLAKRSNADLLRKLKPLIAAMPWVEIARPTAEADVAATKEAARLMFLPVSGAVEMPQPLEWEFDRVTR